MGLESAATVGWPARDAGAPSAATVAELYQREAAGIRSALARLAGWGIDPDDLLQEVFVVALRRRDALESADSPRSWLYGVAAKIASDHRRRHRLRRFLGLEAAPELLAPSGPIEAVEAAETRARVYAALDRLSTRKREVLVLYEMEGLSGEEIAQAVGCPVKTVWTRLFHARRAFARAVEDAR